MMLHYGVPRESLNPMLRNKHGGVAVIKCVLLLIMALVAGTPSVGAKSSLPYPAGECVSGRYELLGGESQTQDFVLGLAPIQGDSFWSLGYGVAQNPDNKAKTPLVLFPTVRQGLPDPNAGPNGVLGRFPTRQSRVSSLTLGVPAPLAQYWNGQQFHSAVLPSIKGVQQDMQAAVTVAGRSTGVVGSNIVWAVGTAYFTNSPPSIYTMRWLGNNASNGGWTSIPVPVILNSESTVLRALSAIADNDVWAVGSWYKTDVGYQNLAMHWNGVVWSVISTPSPSTFQSLYAVTSVNANDVWATGAIEGPNGGRTLTLHWDGSTWTIVPSPSPLAAAWLNGVTALAANDVWAVGRVFPTSNPFVTQTLTLHWNGLAWTIVPSPNAGPTGSSNELLAVTATSADDVWTAGDWRVDTNHSATLILHYAAGHWTEISTPNLGPLQNSLYTIRAGSIAADPQAGCGRTIWAAGGYYDTNGIAHPLHMRYILSALVP